MRERRREREEKKMNMKEGERDEGERGRNDYSSTQSVIPYQWRVESVGNLLRGLESLAAPCRETELLPQGQVSVWADLVAADDEPATN